MRQFIILVFQFLFIAVFDEIDVAFGNNIDIDSIVVLMSFTVIQWVTYSIQQIGFYGWRVRRKNERTTLVVGLVTVFIEMFVVIALSGVIPRIYDLTQTQYILFQKCLVIEAIMLIPHCISNYYYEWMVYRECNRLIFVTNVIYYALMFFLDWVAVKFFGSLVYILLSTLISVTIYDIIVVICIKLPKYEDDMTKPVIKDILRHGCNTVWDRLTGKVATIVFNIYASKLGGLLYAVHCVCYNIAVFSETFTNALGMYDMIHLVPYSEKDRYKTANHFIKIYSPILLIMCVIIDFVLLLLTKGEVPLKNCIWVIPYSLNVIPLLFYESYKAVLSLAGRTDILRWCGTIGILIRVPLTIICYHMHLGILPFSILTMLDFSGRAIYLWYYVLKYDKSLKIEEI